MSASFTKFSGFSAILVGVLSILYAVFYLIVSQSSPALGTNASWLILSISGIFSSAAFIGLYLHLKETSSGFSLWALSMGLFASLATFIHGGYELQLIHAINTADNTSAAQLAFVQQAPSQVDPAGLATFFLTGLVTFIYSYFMAQNSHFPRPLSAVGMVNAVLLVILYFSSSFNIHTLVLVSGGLTSVILGPIWWIWLGICLRKM